MVAGVLAAAVLVSGGADPEVAEAEAERPPAEPSLPRLPSSRVI